METFRVDSFRGTKFAAVCPKFHYILSQIHLDHIKNRSKQFPCHTWTSAITRWLMNELFSENKWNILFVTLHVDAWNQLDDQTKIYVFDSGHCMGSIGFYSPQESLLYFHEGRPTEKVQRAINRAILEYPPLHRLQMVIDDFFATRFPKITDAQNIPSMESSSAILYQFITSQIKSAEKQRITIWIKLPHLGAFDILPVIPEVHYEWIGSESTLASRLCKHAFNLLHDTLNNQTHLEQKPTKSRRCIVFLSRSFDRDIGFVPERVDATVLISACWFLLSKTRLQLVNTIPYDSVRQVHRLFLCQHASPKETKHMLSYFKATPFGHPLLRKH